MVVEVACEVFEDIGGQVAVLLLFLSLEVILSFLSLAKSYATLQDPLLADCLPLQLRTLPSLCPLIGQLRLRV